VLPDFLIGFLGNDTVKISVFLSNYLLDLESDQLAIETAIENAHFNTISAIAHKMQTMIGQFQEKDLLAILKTIEEKAKTTQSISELEFELHNLSILLAKFHEKIKHLIRTD